MFEVDKMQHSSYRVLHEMQRMVALRDYHFKHFQACASILCDTTRMHGSKTARCISQRMKRGKRKSKNALNMYQRHASRSLMSSTEHIAGVWPFPTTQSSLWDNLPESSREAHRVRSQSTTELLHTWSFQRTHI